MPSIPPTTAEFGWREFATLVEFLIRFYLRHKSSIDQAFDSTIVQAMSVLTQAVAPGGDIEVMNQPGPE